MKGDNIFEAMSFIDPELIADADAYSKIHEKVVESCRKKRRIKWMSSFAAAMVSIVLSIVIIVNSGVDTVLTSYAISTPNYPQMSKYPSAYNSEEYNNWRNDIKKQWQYYNAGDNLDEFFIKSIQAILLEVADSNAVYSPVNIYMALSMLAEISSGETRKQILDILGSESIEELRTQAYSVWNACYRNDGLTDSRIANSVWLNQNVQYNGSTVNTLSSQYYASVFQGDMGSQKYSECYREWMKKETGGLLDDMINELSFDKYTTVALASTLYFETNWHSKFDKKDNSKRIFHTVDKDVECDFMNTSYIGDYYYGNDFSSVCKRLENDGEMYMILPDEGVSVSELLTDEEVLSFLFTQWEWEKQATCNINLALPKFDISMKKEISSDLTEMGITDCFDSQKADLTKLFSNGGNTYLQKAEHGARIIVDENGCKGSAYTSLMDAGASFPDETVDFTLDRPFIFVITGPDGLPLFIGIVNQP